MQWKLIIDFGLVVLIWMTQLVVYPSFTYFSETNLLNWHTKYTSAVSIIVMPLMLGQVVFHGWDISQHFGWLKLIAVLLIAAAWINTFFFAVPLHNKIAAGIEVSLSAEKLVRVNLFRTVVWSLVFLFGIVEHLRR